VNKLCVTMIVKDEEHVIERCLRSVLPIIDCWSIVDTGSSDSTKKIIQNTLQHLPGKLHERPWVDFAHNRSESISLAKGMAAYDLVIDADDVLDIPTDFQLPTLTHDVYNLIVDYGTIQYPRPHIFKGDIGLRYTSVVHEYLDVPETMNFITGMHYRVLGGGNRSRDPVSKFEKDAATLRQALEKEPGHHRYTFYLGQAYKDIGVELMVKNERKKAFNNFRKALSAYEKRAMMVGSYYQEVFVSLLECGKLQERLESPEGVVQSAYLKAYDNLPERGVEALYELARYYRFLEKIGDKRWPRAYLFACAGHEYLAPTNALFADPSVYKWKYDFERATSAFYVGRKDESKRLYEKLLEIAPVDQHVTLLENLKFFPGGPTGPKS
jgi:glycosyltransferase involved in cell wall biosynthesis